jgi:hypothetical protein
MTAKVRHNVRRNKQGNGESFQNVSFSFPFSKRTFPADNLARTPVDSTSPTLSYELHGNGGSHLFQIQRGTRVENPTEKSRRIVVSMLPARRTPNHGTRTRRAWRLVLKTSTKILSRGSNQMGQTWPTSSSGSSFKSGMQIRVLEG